MLALVLLALGAPQSLAGQGAASPGSGAQALSRRACPPAAIGNATCAALVRIPPAGQAPPAALTRRASPAGRAAPAAGEGEEPLTPGQLADAYEYNPSSGGSGQVVAIVDAYQDPQIEADLAAYDAHYGLASCTEGDGCLEKVGQSGTASLPARDSSGWSVETSLDVETVHSVCAKCKILLVDADSESFTNLAAAEDTAVRLGATVVSNSYSGPEEGMDSAQQAAYDHPGVVIAAATGDDGYYDWDFYNEGASSAEIPAEPGAPASLPDVVSVGGTSLVLDGEGKRSSEVVWNNDGPGDEFGLSAEIAAGAGGGGCSTLFSAPLWQQDAPGFSASGCGSKRLSADVAADANPDTGVEVYDSYDCGASCEEFGIGRGTTWITVGGTSLATPLIGAMWALAGGSDGMDDPALTLYGHLKLHTDLYDVTAGGNGYCDGEKAAACGKPPASFGEVDCDGSTACNAARGFDGPTGVGTPRSLGLFKAPLPAAAITTPGAQLAGSSSSFSAAKSSDPYPGGSIVEYRWNWGDGSPESTGVAPSHTYAAPGTYTVTLTILDSYGLSSAPATLPYGVYADAEEAAAARKAEEEAAAIKRGQEEAAAKKAEEEELATRKTEEEAEAKRSEEEASRAKLLQEEAEALHEEEVARHEEEVARSEERLAQERLTEEEAQRIIAELGSARGRHEALLAQRSSLASGLTSSATPTAAAAAVPVPDARVVGSSLSAGAAGGVRVRISCPAGESWCIGTVTLRTLHALSTGLHRRRAILTLASGSFSLAGGGVQTLTLQLRRSGRTLLARQRRIAAQAVLAAHDPAGAQHTGVEVVALLAPPRRSSRRR